MNSSEIAEYKQRVAEVEHDIGTINTRLTEMNRRLDSIGLGVAGLIRQRDEAIEDRQATASMSAKSINAIQARLDDADESYRVLNEELNLVRTRLDIAIEENEALQRANERLRKLAREVVDMAPGTSERATAVRNLRKELFVQEGRT